MHNFIHFWFTFFFFLYLTTLKFLNFFLFFKFRVLQIFFLFYCDCWCGLRALTERLREFWLKIFALMGRKVLGKNTLLNVIFVTLRIYFMTKMTQFEINSLKTNQCFDLKLQNYYSFRYLTVVRSQLREVFLKNRSVIK